MAQNKEKTLKDVTIIGAGPVGLFALFQCGMLGLSTQIVDSLDDLGGQCTALYPEKPIYDIPAYPEISGEELINALIKQANVFDYDAYLGQFTQALKQNPDNSFTITTSTGNVLTSKAIIIAAGAGAFGPNRPPLDNIQNYEGVSVFYYVKDLNRFKDKRVVIAGGGDSAVDWALTLSGHAKHVALVHRRDKFRATPESVNILHKLQEEGRIQLETGWQLSHLEGHAPHLEAVYIKNFDEEEKRLEADIFLPFFGLSNDLSAFSSWPIEIDHHKIVVDPLTNQTGQAGIFAVGDVCSYPHKLTLILTGFSEVATAAHQIRSYLNPDKSFHFQHSTSLKPEDRKLKDI